MPPRPLWSPAVRLAMERTRLGMGDWARTSDLLIPNQTRFQLRYAHRWAVPRFEARAHWAELGVDEHEPCMR